MNLGEVLTNNAQYLIPVITFLITILLVKPWKKVIDLNSLIFLLFIDALTFRTFFFLNFYKVIALARSPLTFKEITQSQYKFYLFPFFIFFVSVPLLFSVAHILVGDINAFHSDILNNSNYISVLSNFFNFLSILLFSYEIYKSIKNEKKFTLNALNLLSLIIALGVIFEFFTRFDTYHFFTGGRPLPLSELYNRPRGFSFEPRGAVQSLSILIGAQLLLNNKKTFYIIIPLLIWAALLPLSVSGLAVGAIIVFICCLFFIASFNKEGLFKTCYIIILSILIYNVSGITKRIGVHFRDRAYVVAPSNENSFLLKIANRLEVGDGAYLNFLEHNPKFWVVGTGIMSVNAAKKWVLEKDSLMETKYLGNPFFGSLFLHSMYGIFSLFFLAAVLSRLLDRKNWKDKQDVLFNILIMLGGVTYFYVLPFILIACFIFSKKIFKTIQKKYTSNSSAITL